MCICIAGVGGVGRTLVLPWRKAVSPSAEGQAMETEVFPRSSEERNYIPFLRCSCEVYP